MDAMHNVTNKGAQQAVVRFDTKGYSQETAKPPIPVYDAFIPMPASTIEIPQKPEIQKMPEKKKFDFETLKTGLKNIPRFIGKTIGGTIGGAVCASYGLLLNSAVIAPFVIPFSPMNPSDKDAAMFFSGLAAFLVVGFTSALISNHSFSRTLALIITSPVSLGIMGAKWGANLLGEEIPNAIGGAFKEAISLAKNA